MQKPILYRITRPIITILFRIIYRPTYKGLEYINDASPNVVAGNHTNNLDCLLLISSTKKTLHFLAKDSLIKGPKKIIFKNMGIIPVNRKIHDKQALNKAIEELNNNKTIAIFPEGTINRTNEITLPFKIGAIKMAHDTNTKILPFTIVGKYKPFKKSITLEFYEPYKINDDLTKENENLQLLISNNLLERKE